MKSVLIIGATSAIAEHTAREFAVEKVCLYLSARDVTKVEHLKEDLLIRGASRVEVLPAFDAGDPDSLNPLIKAVEVFESSIDVVLISHGHLPDQPSCEAQVDETAQELEINFGSVIKLCTVLANRLSDQGHGTLAVISSVAGLRGRQSNYVYGAAKGGLNIFLQGLRNRLYPKGVRVVTLLPGFVDTPMTSDIEKGPLFISSEKAGRLIHRSLTRGKLDVVYIPFFWRYILWVIRAIPETLFKRLKL